MRRIDVKKTKIGSGGELQITDAIFLSSKINEVWGYKFSGKRYDCGNKIGFLKAQIAVAFKDKEIKDLLAKDYKKYNKQILDLEMKISKEEIDELLSCELRSITVSLQGTVKSKSDPSELVDILPSDQTQPMELAEVAERTASAWTLLDKANLTEKERKIVSLRFGLDGSNEWRTLAEVARHMSCSREYCRQVVQRALRKLRKAGIQNGLVDSVG